MTGFIIGKFKLRNLFDDPPLTSPNPLPPDLARCADAGRAGGVRVVLGERGVGGDELVVSLDYE